MFLDTRRTVLPIQLHICLLLILLLVLEVAVVVADAPIARPGCKSTCGNVSIPYPFGIGANCFLDPWFEIECNGSKPKPLLSKFNNIEVMEIFMDGFNPYGPQSLIVKIPPQLSRCSLVTQPHQHTTSINFQGTPYKFSAQDNVFVVEGCSGSAVLRDQHGKVMGGCGTVCYNNNSMIPENSCYGVRCCHTTLSSDLSSLPFYQIDSYLQASSSGNCLVTSLIKSEPVDQYAGKLLSSGLVSAAPVVLSWSWTSSLNPDNSTHSKCTRSGHNLYCECVGNAFGNAYVSNGCQVPEDCKGCRGYCHRQTDGEQLRTPPAYECESEAPNLAVILEPSISVGLVLLVIGIYGLYRVIRRRREMKRRAHLFKLNGGLLLQQQLSSDGVVDKTKIFSITELEKATDHFSYNRILGQGGQGTVYKGMLSNGRIVAVKRAKLIDKDQLKQFINEVVILSQVNHRNVVKLLGCCLETKVPLLVYEFISNGTLSQHIHDPDEDFVISWEMRMRIAADSASAIAYLHSSSSVPIYHRDIKTANILLDEKHRAKVSDFGSSKSIAIDQTHLTTLAQGTFGYLDPEYFQSNQFTEKSDVYSFGVVLLEILTGKKPIYKDENMEQKNLVTEFLLLTRNSGLSKILDPEIVKQAKEEELIAFVDLAKCCVSQSGKQRPTMKEVAMALEMIIKSPAQASSCYQQHEGLAMTEARDVLGELMSSPIRFHSASASPQYTDVQPLLPHTI